MGPEQAERLAEAGGRAGWALKRAPLVAEFVRCWVEEGCRADAIFEAARPEWSTEGLTAAEWVERCFIHLKQEAPAAVGGAALDRQHPWAPTIAPFLDTFQAMQTTVLTQVHCGIAVTGPTSEAQREEHLRKVQGLFDALSQNVGTQMRNCKGVVDLARRLQTLLGRMRSVGVDSRRLVEQLVVAAGAYTEDVEDLGRVALGAMRDLDGVMRAEIARVGGGMAEEAAVSLLQRI